MITNGNLTIHVFGGKKGESIVVEGPGNRWGVIDCYASDPNDPKSNPAFQLLEAAEVSELEFACLTHPHDDHYRGLGQLLTRFPVKWFWHSGLETLYGRRLIDYIHLEAEEEGSQEAEQSANVYSTIMDIIDKRKKSKLMSLKGASPATLLYPVPADFDAPFKIFALAPSNDQIHEYLANFRGCFDKQGRFLGSLPRQHHNKISVALLLVYGETRILFGGDVEIPGWRDSIREWPANELFPHLIKVSHHGSSNGSSEQLWTYFARGGKPYAVVTAFATQHLPRNEVLDLISNYAERVLITSGGSRSRPHAPLVHQPDVLLSRIALQTRFVELGDRNESQNGQWSITFDNAGKCVKCESLGGATEFK